MTALKRHVEFLGDDLRQRGAHAGAEIDLAGIDRHHALGVDREKRIDLGRAPAACCARRLARAHRRSCGDEREADDERAAALEEIAPRRI